ncbi:Uncharacterised protein [Klebsiella variicola]|uniref:Uncharacterized protein n=1 Tax=Klebsiella variicola TaxID=244366 RepID=A0A7H4MJC6_KLEVA|nr:Uncharacterised protein [Klebsiella variicola]
MAAADKMLGHQLRRLHVVRADQIDIVKVAGAGSKHQRHAGLRGPLAQFAPAIDRPGDDHPVDPLRREGIKPLVYLLAAAPALGEEHHFPLPFQGVGEAGG